MATLEGDPRLLALWYGAGGGLLAWTLHLVVGYFLITGSCLDTEARVAGDPVLTSALFVALTLVLAALAAGALFAAARFAREARSWRRFLGVAGVLLDGLALGTILLGGTQLLWLGPCA
jgi:hypothetical protein